MKKFYELSREYKIDNSNRNEMIASMKSNQELLKSETRMKSVICSYDFKDNETYKGIQQIEKLYLMDDNKV